MKKFVVVCLFKQGNVKAFAFAVESEAIACFYGLIDRGVINHACVVDVRNKRIVERSI